MTMNRTVFIRGAFLLIAATALAFGASLLNQFVDWDDISLIMENPLVQQPSLAHLWGVFTSYDPELYVPVTMMSFQFEHIVHGNMPALTHLLNILLHITNVLLVWRIAAKLLKNETAALLVALLFAVHPIQTEAVAWATGRKDLLSATFFLLSLFSYMRGMAGKVKRWYAVSIVAFVLGLLSKVTIAPLPLVLLLLERREHGKITAASLHRTGAFFVFSIIFIAIALAGKSEALGVGSMLQTILLVPYSIVFLAGKVLIPLHLAPLYPFTDPITIMDPHLWGSIIGLGCVAVLIGKMSKRYPIVAFGALFALIMLLPSFANFRRGDYFLDIYTASDRSAYLPLIGLLFMLTPLITLLRKWAEWTAIGLAIMCIILSMLQTRRWHDTDTLFAWTAIVSPNSHIAQMNVGNMENREGMYVQAIDRYTKALDIRETPLATYNLGKALAATGQTDDAIRTYQRAFQLDPTMLDAALNIGTALLREGRTDDAIAVFKDLATNHPDYIPAAFNWAVALSQGEHDDQAIPILERLVTKNPDFEQGARALAELYAKNGRAEEAKIILGRLRTNKQ